jgi:hypothetical protein
MRVLALHALGRIEAVVFPYGCTFPMQIKFSDLPKVGLLARFLLHCLRIFEAL